MQTKGCEILSRVSFSIIYSLFHLKLSDKLVTIKPVEPVNYINMDKKGRGSYIVPIIRLEENLKVEDAFQVCCNVVSGSLGTSDKSN